MEPTACSRCGHVAVPSMAAGTLVLCRTCTDVYLSTSSGSLVYSALVKGAEAWLQTERLAQANAQPGPKRLELIASPALRVLPGGKP